MLREGPETLGLPDKTDVSARGQIGGGVSRGKLSLPPPLVEPHRARRIPRKQEE
jgi:hypothetical protein